MNPQQVVLALATQIAQLVVERDTARAEAAHLRQQVAALSPEED